MALIDMSEIYQMTNAGDHIDGTDVYQSNRNLLDNPWFTVNQRRVTSGSVGISAYVGPDRWKIFQASSWNVQNNAVTLAWNGSGSASGILQYTGPENGNPIKGKTATISAYVNGTLLSKTVTIPAAGSSSDYALSNDVIVRINSDDEITNNRGVEVQFRTTSISNITIGPVKLELGSVSTLANDTPPDYGTELLKCQRYFYRVVGNGTGSECGWAYYDTASRLRVCVPLPTQLRTYPSITLGGTIAINLNGAFFKNATSVAMGNVSGTILMILVNNNTAPFTTGQQYQPYLVGTTSYLDISADI